MVDLRQDSLGQYLQRRRATATFDCAGLYIDTYQLVKLDGEWRIANKFFTERQKIVGAEKSTAAI